MRPTGHCALLTDYRQLSGIKFALGFLLIFASMFVIEIGVGFMDKVWVSKFSVVAAFIIVVLCVIFILDSYTKGIEVPERVWGLLGGGLMLLFGIQLPTPGVKQ